MKNSSMIDTFDNSKYLIYVPFREIRRSAECFGAKTTKNSHEKKIFFKYDQYYRKSSDQYKRKEKNRKEKIGRVIFYLIAI